MKNENSRGPVHYRTVARNYAAGGGDDMLGDVNFSLSRDEKRGA